MFHIGQDLTLVFVGEALGQMTLNIYLAMLYAMVTTHIFVYYQHISEGDDLFNRN